jgi:hypothetical protein
MACNSYPQQGQRENPSNIFIDLGCDKKEEVENWAFMWLCYYLS